MKQAKVAKKHGLEPSHFNRLLNGKVRAKSLRAGLALQYAQLLDMPLEELVNASPGELKLRYMTVHECGEANG